MHSHPESLSDALTIFLEEIGAELTELGTYFRVFHLPGTRFRPPDFGKIMEDRGTSPEQTYKEISSLLVVMGEWRTFPRVWTWCFEARKRLLPLQKVPETSGDGMEGSFRLYLLESKRISRICGWVVEIWMKSTLRSAVWVILTKSLDGL